MTIQHAKELVAVSNPQILAYRDDLTKAVSIAGEAIERRNTAPILGNVRITGHGTFTTVSATDLDMVISVKIPAASDSRFDTTIDGRQVLNLLKKARKSEMAGLALHAEFKGEDCEQSATLDLEKTKYDLNALPTDGYPTMREFGDKVSKFEIDGASFWTMLNAVKGAMSDETVRYYLNGIHMHMLDGQLIAVATDGHRLARIKMSGVSGDLSNFEPVLIPRKAVKIAHKLMKGKNCPSVIRFTSSDDLLEMRFDDVTITTKLIDGNFPDYHRVIPNNEIRLAMDSADMVAAMTDVSLISSSKGRAVKFSLENGKCEFSVIDQSTGSASAAIHAEYYSDEMEIGFNSTYISEMLAWACPNGGTIEFLLNSSGDPARIIGTLEGFDGVVMPVRI